MSEQNFPRGGTTLNPGKNKNEKNEKKDKDLFQIHNESSGRKRKKDKNTDSKLNTKGKKQKYVKKPRLGGSQFQVRTGMTETLNLKSITQGMLLLGVVKDIHDYEVIVSLPNGHTGIVQITNISDSYKAILQKITEGDTDIVNSQEEFGTLQELFHVGQPVRCKVLDVIQSKKFKSKVKLSLNPKDVNEGVKASNIKSSMVLSGSVSSKEDHGYVIDLGISGITAFLKNKDAEKYMENEQETTLKTGKYIDCCIKNSEKLDLVSGAGGTVHVVVEKRKVYRSMLNEGSNVPLSSLVPGMMVQCKVEKPTENGMVVKFLTYKGVIHRSHMEESPDSYTHDQKVKASILYIHPSTKAVTLTLLTHLVTPDLAPRKLFADVKFGDIIEEAETIRVDKNRGVYSKLTERVKGFASMKQLSDKEVPEVKKVFPPQSKHKCRVMDFCYADNIVLVTYKESVINQQFLKYADIIPGTLVQCEVRGIHDKGVSVKVTHQIKGFIPTIHLANVPLHHPEKKFKEGTKLNCRVLTVDKSKNKLILCNKKSLVKTKYPIINSYEQCKRGMTLQGVVVDIRDNGILLIFYNNVKGWVSKAELSTEFIEYPQKVFYEGQVVKGTVLVCNPEESRLRLTLKVSDKMPFGTKELELPEGIEVGKIVSCKITRKRKEGFDVHLPGENVNAFLPKHHLSDHMSLIDLLIDMYKEGDTLPDVLCTGTTNILVVSNKRSLKQAERDQTSVKEFSQLKPGLLVSGTLKNTKSYGVFVDLNNRLAGLVPNKYICDKYTPNPSTLYKEGQSVTAKVAEVDNEKKNFLMSLKMSDCYLGDTSIGIELLDDFLQEYNAVLEGLAKRKGALSHLVTHKIGEQIKVTVTEVNEHGSLCELKNKVKGFVTFQNMIGVQVKPGDKVDAVVLYIDPVAKCIELSLSPDLVKAMKHFNDNKFTAAKVGQILKCHVQLVKEDFVLVSLKGHAAGRIAFMPAKKMFNDVLEYRQFSVGQLNHVVVKKVTPGQILVGLKMYENEDEISSSREMSSIVGHHELKLGDIVSAIVQSIMEHQLNIRIHGVAGRVHNTEIVDKMKKGTNPLTKFKQGDQIKVKILGFRDAKTHKYLNANHPYMNKSLPECSMKPSVLSVKGHQKGEAPVERVYSVGDKVMAFMSSYNHHCLWMQLTAAIKGKVYILNASKDLEILREPLLHFKTGNCYKATVISKQKDGVCELSLIGVPEKVQKNAVVRGFIVSRSIRQGLILQLCDGYRGRVAITDLWDKYREDPLGGFMIEQAVKCAVVGFNKQQKDKLVLSLRKSRLDQDISNETSVVDREVHCKDQLKIGDVIRGYVVNCNKKGVFVSLGTDVTGYVNPKHMSKHHISEPEKVFVTGKVVRVKILQMIPSKTCIGVSLLEQHTGVAEDIPAEYIIKDTQNSKQEKKRKNSETELNDVEKPKKKRQNSESETNCTDKTLKTKANKKEKKKKKKPDEVEQSEEVSVVKKKKKEVIVDKRKVQQNDVPDTSIVKLKDLAVENTDSGVEVKDDSESDEDEEVMGQKEDSKKPGARLSLSAGFSWDSSFQMPTIANNKGEESDSEDSDDEQASNEKQNKKKQMKDEFSLEEHRIYQREHELMDTERMPIVADDFDRLVLQSPDSSIVWLRYMAFHLETAEFEKARAVAERALKTIAFREEQEKLNIWVAYMNLENMYGTHESLMGVFDRALKHGEPIKVYQQLIAIFVKSGKIESAEQLHSTMLKKFSLNREVWVNFGMFYFKNGKVDSARKLLERSFKSLEKKEHVEVIAKFAQMEFKHGDPERGKSMFENIISTYHKRTDLWSVYIDMVTKLGDIEVVRELYERLIHTNLSAKKMKFCFKKYMEFEQKHGNENSVNTVKQKAIEYVESKNDLET